MSSGNCWVLWKLCCSPVYALGETIQGGSSTCSDHLCCFADVVNLLGFSKYLTDKFLKASIPALLENAGFAKNLKISPAIKMQVLWVIRRKKASKITTWWKFQDSGLIEEVHGPRVGYQTWIPACPCSRISPSHPESHFIIQVKSANNNPGTVTQWRKYTQRTHAIFKKIKSKQIGIRRVFKRKEKECIVRNTSLPAHTMHCISLNLGEFLRTALCKCIVQSKVRIVFSGFKMTVYSSTSRMEKEENICWVPVAAPCVSNQERRGSRCLNKQ